MTTFGTDPEFFIFDKTGRAVPAHALGFPTKEQKLNARDLITNENVLMNTPLTAYASLFRDGYAIEGNTSLIGTCRAQLSDTVRAMLRGARAKVGTDYTIGTAATVRIRLRSQMKDAPDDVSHFGCEPSFDGYDRGAAKVVTIDAGIHPYRYAGGHMHFGCYNPEAGQGYKDQNTNYLRTVLETPSEFPLLAKMMDLFIGLPLTIIYGDAGQFLRRRHYGQAGEYRPQFYSPMYVGFEYRTPPPQVWNHHATAGLFYGVGKWVINNYEAIKEQWTPAIENDLKKYINKGKGKPYMLQGVPGFYSAETIFALKGIEDVQKLSFIDHNGSTEQGWTEFASKWGISKTIPTANFIKHVSSSSPFKPLSKPVFNFITAKSA